MDLGNAAATRAHCRSQKRYLGGEDKTLLQRRYSIVFKGSPSRRMAKAPKRSLHAVISPFLAATF
jgi:hypothetical protein